MLWILWIASLIIVGIIGGMIGYFRGVQYAEEGRFTGHLDGRVR